jgi:hypothetical protein
MKKNNSRESLSRRSLLATALPALFAPNALSQAGPVINVTVTNSLSKMIASGIAQKVLGKLGDSLFAQLGFGGGPDPAIMEKLNEIINRLLVLQASVEKLTDVVMQQFSEVRYAQSAETARQIDKVNGQLLRPYRQMLRGDSDSKKEFYRRVDENIVELRLGLQSWHDGMMGQPDLSLPGMLQAFNRATVKNHHGLLGPNAAAEIQAHWDRLDYAQSLTALFLIEDKINKGDADGVRYVFREWRELRQEQLKGLRACLRKTDEFYTLENPNRPEVTALNYLPANTAITPENSTMWYTEALGPIARRNTAREFEGSLGSARGQGKRMCDDVCGGWALQSTDSMRVLTRACARPIGSNNFVQGMREEKFNLDRRAGEWSPAEYYFFTGTHANYFTNETRGVGAPQFHRHVRVQVYNREIIGEGKDTITSNDGDDHGVVIFGRGLSSEEAARYFYSGSSIG